LNQIFKFLSVCVRDMCRSIRLSKNKNKFFSVFKVDFDGENKARTSLKKKRKQSDSLLHVLWRLVAEEGLSSVTSCGMHFTKLSAVTVSLSLHLKPNESSESKLF